MLAQWYPLAEVVLESLVAQVAGAAGTAQARHQTYYRGAKSRYAHVCVRVMAIRGMHVCW